MKKEENAIKMANELLMFVNAYDFDEKTFAETICRGHRTLQQSVMRLFMATIQEMSQNTFDDRNVIAVKLAKNIVAATENVHLPLI